MFGLSTLQILLIGAPPILFALTIHEYAHAWAAYQCGDPTARDRGRLTLDPLAHLDPIGTLCLFISLTQGFGFGWAKPVPVQPAYFRHPRRDDILVSAAGVAANLLTAITVATILRLTLHASFWNSRPGAVIWLMGTFLCMISIGLLLFNLIPLPPLDGSHILKNLLPREAAIAYERLMPYGGIILLVLIFSHALSYIIGPPFVEIMRLLLGPALISRPL